MGNQGTNKSKITISLRAEEREAIAKEAERQGVAIPTLCASLIRKHIKKRVSITNRQTRPADNHGGGIRKNIAKAKR